MHIPENGFYYHYKHDPAGAFNNYAYEVVGLARHSEDKSHYVMYRPLYKAEWLIPAQVVVRPLTTFLEHILKDGKLVPRFRRIQDIECVAKLNQVRDSMYAN